MSATTFSAPRLDDTAQRLLWKIANFLWVTTGLASALSGSGSPVGLVVPGSVGQLYHDTLNDVYYRSTGTGAADWSLA